MKMNYLKLAKKAYEIADSKKAVNPLILNIRRLTPMADYFVIASGESSPQINAIIDTIYKTFRDDYGLLPIHRDGRGSDHWTAIDYGGLVVHIMNEASRKLYGLEKIWDKARIVKTTVKRKKK